MVVVVALALGIGVVAVAMRARSDDSDVAGAVTDPADPRSPESDARRRALAASAGVRVEDLLVQASHPEGVTPEEFEASRLLRLEAAGPEAALAAEAALGQRLEWAAEYAAGQRRQLARQAGLAEVVSAVDPVVAESAEPTAADRAAAEPASCRPFCELLRRCNGPEEPGDWAGCIAACGRGEFGIEAHLQSVVTLDDCEHP